MWAELFGNSWEDDLTAADEQEPKQPNSRNRPRCRLDLLPSGTEELLKAKQEAGKQVLPDFTSSITVVMHIRLNAAKRCQSRRKYTSWTLYHVIICRPFRKKNDRETPTSATFLLIVQ